MTGASREQPVLFLLGTLEIGGSETKFVRLANRLQREGYPVHIAYLRAPDSLLEKIESVPTVHLNQRGKWSLAAYRNLREYVRRHRVRTIVNVNLYPLVYSVPLSRFNGDLRLRVLASINTSEILSERERRFMRLYRRLLRRCQLLIFGSKKQCSDWIERYALSGNSSTVIYNGVDGTVFSPSAAGAGRDDVRNRLGIPAEAFTIVCVSQFRPEKGQQNLVRAVAALEKRSRIDLRVILVGDGSERPAIDDAIRACGVEDRIILVGAVDDVRPYLNAADLFVLPSTAVETFSNAALEAGAMGLPAVISDVGGAREMFPEGSSGIVYHRDSVQELTDAIGHRMSAAQADDAQRAAIRRETLKRFDVSRMDADWVGVLWSGADQQAVAT